MKSFQMKALALAMLGLGGLVMAGTASAACTNTTPFAAWSSWNGVKNLGAQGGGVTVAGNGLNGTSCSMASSFNIATLPGSNGAQAIVYDNSPQLEQTYRFRFYIDPTNIAANLSTTKTVYIFQALSTSPHGSVTPTNRVVAMELLGQGGNVTLATLAGCSSGDNQVGNLCRATNNLTLPSPFTNGIRVEGQVTIGTAGTGKVNVWIGSNVNPASPDATINVDNSAWGTANTDGVKQAAMGLFGTTPVFRSNNNNQTVLFDEFDSRRQTFIGS
jgi:hypothetical protein